MIKRIRRFLCKIGLHDFPDWEWWDAPTGSNLKRVCRRCGRKEVKK